MRAVMLAVLAGCSYTPPAVGALPDSPDTPVDQGTEPADVAMLGPFTNLMPIGELNSSATEDDPTLTGDMLEIYFDRDGDIFRSSRTSIAASWAVPAVVTELNSVAAETTPEISADGLTIHFSSDRQGGSTFLDIYVATRPDRATNWSVPAPVAELSSADQDTTPMIVEGGLTIYLSRTPIAGTNVDIFRATRATTTSPWSAPALVAGLDTPNAETEPWVDGTECSVWVISDRPGTAGLRDIWFATRATSTAPVTGLVPIVELNSVVDEQDPWLSPDQRTIVFASVRSGNFDLYTATR